MAGEDVRVRPATEADAAALLGIYAPYVERTAITFEYEVPGVAEFRDRVAATLAAGRPYLVLEGREGASGHGAPLGYAYTSAFVGRAAYQWAEETSIYLAWDARGRGLGRRLHQALANVERSRGILNLEACIGYADPEDAHLTNASARFHARLGYRMVGRFSRCGYKFGTWYDMVWMERLLGEHPEVLEPPARLDELEADVLAEALRV